MFISEQVSMYFKDFFQNFSVEEQDEEASRIDYRSVSKLS